MRILVAEDDASVTQAYRLCLDVITKNAANSAEAMSLALFDEAPAKGDASARWSAFDLVRQGAEAVERVRVARESGEPYAVLFLDMLMPPGIDGRETARQVREIDPEINIVMVTGYSDHTPADLVAVAGPEDKIFFLAKPFETLEIRTLANSLCAKWSLEHELTSARKLLADHVLELEIVNRELGASEARCRHLAFHDQLTHLPNRLAFQQHLESEIGQSGAEIAVVFVDLDRFKHINDTLGHAAGDELICLIGNRLASQMPEGALLARLGGDEFGIVMTGPTPGELEALGQACVATCGQPFHILGSLVQVGASIGIARSAGEPIRASELLRRADLALYAAKGHGRNRVELFVDALDESARKRAEVEERLRYALAHDELRLAYQPIQEPGSHEPVGYEALLRWYDVVLGDISPAIFVPIAEETGLILEVGQWVIERAIRDCAAWPNGFVSINLSTRHFQLPSLIGALAEACRRHALPHARVQLEITETALFDDAQLAAKVLSSLRGYGFRIALDDFGTGYSSLVNLKDFEIDCIKIDQSFVAKLGKDRTSNAIVHAVTNLARALGIKVVAEGVENEVQVQALRLTGCELMQGYFFGKAVPTGDLFLENERKTA